MFDPQTVDDLDLRACADALDAAVVEQRRVGARRMALVAHWADLHCPPPVKTPCTGARRHPGGSDGTPEVTEFTATELGMLLGTSTLTALCLLREVLDVRHRLPLIWAAVMTGQVEDWKARKVARATQVLTVEQARWVDAQVLEALIGLPFGRALSVVEGKVVAADPAGFEARRRTEAERRFVSVSRPTNPHGLRTLVAQGSAGDIA